MLHLCGIVGFATKGNSGGQELCGWVSLRATKDRLQQSLSEIEARLKGPV